MMDQAKWKLLEEAFEKADQFETDESGYWEWADESQFEGLDLMDWLECDSRGPDYQMWAEFEEKGYTVFAAEKDSFGWLIGAVKRTLEPKRRITFG